MFDYINFWLAHELAKVLWAFGIIVLAVLGAIVFVIVQHLSWAWKMRRSGYRYKAMHNVVTNYLSTSIRGDRTVFDTILSIIYNHNIDHKIHNPDRFNEALVTKVYLDINHIFEEN